MWPEVSLLQYIPYVFRIFLRPITFLLRVKQANKNGAHHSHVINKGGHYHHIMSVRNVIPDERKASPGRGSDDLEPGLATWKDLPLVLPLYN